VLFLGDVLVAPEILKNFKYPVMTDVQAFIDSKLDILQYRYKFYVMAHGGHVTDVSDIVRSNLDDLYARVEEVFNVLQGDYIGIDTIMEMLNLRYPIDNDIVKYHVALRTVRAYLSYLEEDKRISLRVVDGVLKYNAINWITDM
jgi:hypothetical protein